MRAKEQKESKSLFQMSVFEKGSIYCLILQDAVRVLL